MSDGRGNGSGTLGNNKLDLAAYDKLSPSARRYLQDAPDNIGAESMHKLLRKWGADDSEAAGIIANWYDGIRKENTRHFWGSSHPQYGVPFEPIKRRENTKLTVYERRLAKKGA